MRKLTKTDVNWTKHDQHVSEMRQDLVNVGNLCANFASMLANRLSVSLRECGV